jgi:NADH-ubiquinone oxidoreductase chain 5
LLFLAILSGGVGLIIRRGGELALEWEAFSGFGQKVTLLLLLDFISLIFLRTVCLISGCVFFYSVRYIGADIFNPRFAALVFLFILRMALMILRPNLIRLLLGWDGLGVTSYLLVCYYIREKRFNARMLTALTNRIGDVAILLCISLWARCGIFNYGLVRGASVGALRRALGLVVIAAITKRAQIPFSAWLPAAIAAPTPVSALVHSSTLVTAGVYFLVRINYLILISGWRSWLLTLGLLTITIAGAAAVFELDIKKVIALSTLSQLGVIFFSLGMGQPFMAFFHLISHAYFKAILFMAAGSIIHTVKDYQDLRKIGGSLINLPALSTVCLVRNLRLCGMPFLSGFYSKDLILESLFTQGPRVIIFVVGMVATGLTVVYRCRLTLGIFNLFRGRERYRAEGDSDFFMLSGMSILMGPAIIGGWWLRGLMPRGVLIFIPFWQKLAVLALVLFSAASAFNGLGVREQPTNHRSKFLHQMWFMPVTFSIRLTRGGLTYGKSNRLNADETWLPFLTWQSIFKPRYNIYYLLANFRGGALVSLALIGGLRLIV